mgnify:CR=1 FL=1
MGTWGTAIFDDDFALDIKNEYQTLLAFGTPEQEAFELVKNYFEIDDGDDDESVFWLSIAAIQEKYGILTPEVRGKAIDIIDSGVDLENWEGNDKRTLERRKKSLQDLKAQLLLPNKERKAVRKTRIEKRRFGVGDILVSQLVCKLDSDKWWFDKYVLYKVTEQYRTSVSRIKPKLAYDTWSLGLLYDWIGDYIPTEKDIKNFPFYVTEFYDIERVHFLDWIPKNYTLKVLMSNCISDKIPFEKTPNEFWPSKQANIFNILLHDEQHFKKIYEKYRRS